MNHKQWLSAYLYYGEPWENFLTEAVYPYVKDVLQCKRADRFFFIRYWERGPHIRLRFQGDFSDGNLAVELESSFKNYFRRKPSSRTEPQYDRKPPAHMEWIPNNSVQFVPYEPETERYGGPSALAIGEDQFELSSSVVLDILRDSDAWSYDRALGAAIQLHLGFAHALEMTLDETLEFYTTISEGWFNVVFGFPKKKDTEEEKKWRDSTRATFEMQFLKQKNMLVPFFKMLWGAFNEESEFEQEWLNRWVHGMRDIGKRLQSERVAQKIVFPDYYTDQIPERRQLWFIYSSYVHMTNNRLGILNRDESYLGHLIKRILESL